MDWFYWFRVRNNNMSAGFEKLIELGSWSFHIYVSKICNFKTVLGIKLHTGYTKGGLFFGSEYHVIHINAMC